MLFLCGSLARNSNGGILPVYRDGKAEAKF
jgi:hypothetical protein